MHLAKKSVVFAVLFTLAAISAVSAPSQTNASQRRRANRERRIQQQIQETYSHKFEVELGGGYLRFRPGPNLRHVDEGGWQGSATRYFNERLGIMGDFHGYYGTVGIPPNQFAIYNRGIHEYAYQAGPTYRFYARQKFAVSGHVLAGAATGVFDANTNGFAPELVGLYPVGTVFAATAGASLDYNIDPALALRLSPELLVTRFGGDTQYNRGFTLGIVYRFGRL